MSEENITLQNLFKLYVDSNSIVRLTFDDRTTPQVVVTNAGIKDILNPNLIIKRFNLIDNKLLIEIKKEH